MNQMDYLPANLQNTFYFDCVVGTEYAIPSEDFQVLVAVDGALSTLTIPAQEATSFSCELPIISVGKGEVANLNVLVKAQTSIGGFLFRKSFKVLDVMDIPADVFQVKRKLGLTNNDIVDAEIPLETCYIQTYNSLSVDFHSARLIEPLKTELYSRFLVVFCALKVLPSLYLRLVKKDKTENAEFQRLADAKNLTDIYNHLTEEMNGIIAELGVDLISSDNIFPTILAFVNITPDRITGV